MNETILSYLAYRGWRFKPLIFCHLIVALLLLSFFSQEARKGWEVIDRSVFSLLNLSLNKSPSLRVFWAMANHRLADVILVDLMLIVFFTVALLKAPKVSRLKWCCYFIFCCLLTAGTIILINRLVCHDLLRLRRKSPTYLLTEAVYLSDFIPWMSFKEYSAKTFPADHATTAFMAFFSYAYLVRGRLALLALFYSVFLCLPRLVVGAHWFSDIVVGSGSIALFALSWAFFTPLADKASSFFQSLFKSIFYKKIQ